MVAEFQDVLEDAAGSKIDEAAFAKDVDFIRAMIHYDIDLALFGVDEARRNLIAKDPQAQFALQQFGEAVTPDRAGEDRTRQRRPRATDRALALDIGAQILRLPLGMGAC